MAYKILLPIEDVWDMIGRRLSRWQYVTLGESLGKIIDHFNRSMLRRIEECQHLHGCATLLIFAIAVNKFV